jgi:altronate dehydratase small subunit
MNKLIVMNNKDNVATTLRELKAGELMCFQLNDTKEEIKILNNINYGHKVAIKKIKKGGDVIKYGEVIGTATSDIIIGEHVHIYNVVGNRAQGNLKDQKFSQ